MMFKLYNVVVLVVFLVQLSSKSKASLFGTNYQKIYDTVDDYLVAIRKGNETPEEELDRAIKWLADESPKKSAYAGAIKQLESLKELPMTCSPESYSIIKKNYRSAGSWFERDELKVLESPRPIDKIVLHYLDAHINKCLPIYQTEFMAQVDSDKRAAQVYNLSLGYLDVRLKLIAGMKSDFFWKPTLEDDLREDIVKHPMDFKLQLAVLEVPYDLPSEIVYLGMRYLAEGDTDYHHTTSKKIGRTNRYFVNQIKLYKLYSKYIKKPCKYYIDQFKESSLKALLIEQGLLIEVYLASRQNFLPILQLTVGMVAYDLCNAISDSVMFPGIVNQAFEKRAVLEGGPKSILPA